MCCACGGGESDTALVGLCTDTNDGATDDHTYGCEEYNSGWSPCGDYDDGDFIASSMCCGCGGGSTECRDLDVQ